MEQENFFEFIDEVVGCGGLSRYTGFNFFITLAYVPERHKKPSAREVQWEKLLEETEPEKEGISWHKTPLTAIECFARWRRELELDDLIWVEEYRRDGSTRFHVLVAGWSRWDSDAKTYWQNICGGWALQREPDDRTKGFLGFFVMRLNCGLRVNHGPRRGWYTQSDFRPWREKKSTYR